jgi:hypothetical protein
MVKRPKGAQASKLLTAGSYEYDLQNDQGITLAVQGNLVADYAATAECLLTWVRLHYQGTLLYDAGSSRPRDVTLCVWKADGAASFPDITDSDVIEKLRRDGKLFYLKHTQVPFYGAPRGLLWETEFRNVKLRVGERLNWGIWNHSSASGANLYNEFFVLEYRLVTV